MITSILIGLVIYSCLVWAAWTIMLLCDKDRGYFGAWIMLPFMPLVLPYLIYDRIFKK